MGFRRLILLPALLATSMPVAAAQTPAATQSASEAATSAPPPAYLSHPKFTSALSDAKQLEKQRQYVFAVDALKKANKIAGGECDGCLRKLYELQMGLNQPKDAIATAQQLVDLARTPVSKSAAERQLGSALLAKAGDKPKPDQLAAAHAAYQAALTSYPGNNSALYEDACVLARMGRDAEASKQFAACAEAASPTDPTRIRARHFAENPALSLSKMAPSFEVTALDGTRFNLDNKLDPPDEQSSNLCCDP